MRISHRLFSGIVLIGLIAPVVHPQVAPANQGAFQTSHYRNLMHKIGHSDAEIEARIDAAFQQLFHGDRQTQAIYYETGRNENGPLAYITDVANHDARTEGMSYGMMVAVQTDHKTEFDTIWNWANTYMRITDPKNPAVGYFAWSMNTDGTPRSDGAAPDGEEYFSMALLFAAHRWGNGKGIYDYQAQAEQLLRTMRHHPVLTATGPFRIHPQDLPFEPKGRDGKPFPPRSVTVGPMVSEQADMVLFVPNSSGNEFSDPSYHLPHFYELWARWGQSEDRDFWKRAASVSRVYLCESNRTEYRPLPRLRQLRRQTALFERFNLTLQAAFFDIDGHPEFANPSGDINSTNFGKSTSTLDAGTRGVRTGQLSGRIDF